MKRLQFTKPHNLSALATELQAAIPALRPIPGGSEGRMQAAFALDESGNDIRLWVPDDVVEADVQTVINAHANPPPTDITPPDFGSDAADLSDYPAVRQWVGDSRAYVTNGTPTAAETVQQVKRNARAIMAMFKEDGVMNEEDLAPFIGRIVLENLALSKEIERLRARVSELEQPEFQSEGDAWAWTTPATPVAGTAIQVSFYSTNIRDNLNHLRALLPDAGSSSQILVSSGATSAAWTSNPAIGGTLTVTGAVTHNSTLAQNGDVTMASTRKILWPTETGIKEDYTSHTDDYVRGVGTNTLYDTSTQNFEWRLNSGAVKMKLDMSANTLTVNSNTVATLNSANFTTLQQGGNTVATLNSANFTTLQQGGNTVITTATLPATYGVTGTYTGNGGTSQRVQTTGFAPKLVVISGGTASGSIATAHIHSSSGCGYQDNSNNVEWETSAKLAGDGFTYAEGSVRMNANGIVYAYTAFR